MKARLVPSHEVILSGWHKYANLQLQERQLEVAAALDRRGVLKDQIKSLAEAYTINFQVDPSISLKPINRQVCAQIAAAGEFIANFHISVLGQDVGAFQLREVEIRIARGWQKLFLFDSGKLLICLPDGWGMPFFFRGLSYLEMKRLWQQGNPIFPGLKAKVLWQLINPIGYFRSNLRSSLRLAAEQQVLVVDRILTRFGWKSPGESLPSISDFKGAAIAYLRSTKANELGLNLDLLLRERSETDVAQLLALFQKYLADPQQMEALIEAGSLSLQAEIMQERSQVDIKMWGFVNVGNYHRIDVAVSLSGGYLSKYIQVLPREVQVKAVQVGFVNVYTIDDITVKPNLHRAIAINWEAAALERALEELDWVK